MSNLSTLKDWTMDRRKVIDKKEYTKLFIEIFLKEENDAFWKEMNKENKCLDDKKNAERERRLKQKRNYAKRKELTSLGFLKENKIHVKGIIKYIVTESVGKSYPASNKLEIFFIDYLLSIVRYKEKSIMDRTLSEIFNGFISGLCYYHIEHGNKKGLNLFEDLVFFHIRQNGLSKYNWLAGISQALFNKKYKDFLVLK